MKAPVLVVVVVLLHAVVIGTLVFIPGCGTMDVTAPRVEPPPAPVFPPSSAPDQAVEPVRPLPLQPVARPTPGLKAEEPVLGTYVIQNGDSLSVIAKRHGVTARQLADLNGIKDPSRIRVGQKLIIPGLVSTPEPESRPAARPSAPRPPATPAAPIGAAGEYTIQNGDMLSKVAKKYGVTTRQLAELNGIQDVNRLRVGQKIKVPVAPAAESPAAPVAPPVPEAPAAPVPPAMPSLPEPTGAVELGPANPAEPSDLAPAPAAPAIPATPAAPAITPVSGLDLAPYVVREGDSLETIANAFDTTPEMILKINQLAGAADLRAGQTIQIPCQP